MLISVLYTALVIFGIGLIIFVHELGHYLAARAVGIRVEAFSIGFGTKLWGFKRGPTEYKVCLFPLGGYVKMAGEDPTRPTTGSPDEFGSKKVWQRILVISAGVIMNMVFACVALPVAFSLGVRFVPPVLGTVEPGQTAWKAGLREGDRITFIDGDRVLAFEDVQLEAATSNGPMTVTYERDGVEREVTLTPRDQGFGAPVIGVSPRYTAEFPIDEEAISTQDKEGPALARARTLNEAGLTTEDIVLGLNGIPVTLFPRWLHEIDRTASQAVTLLVKRNGVMREVRLAPVMEDVSNEKRFMIGIRSRPDALARIANVTPGGPADQMGLRAGDTLLTVGGKPFDAAEDLALRIGEGLDPSRTARMTPFPAIPSDRSEVTLTVQRGSGEKETLRRALPTMPERLAFLKSFGLTLTTSTRVEVSPGEPAAKAGVETGDIILSVGGQKTASFEEIARHITAADGAPVTLRVRRNGTEIDVPGVKAERSVSQVNVVLREVYPRAGLASLISEEVMIPFPESIGVGFVYAGRMLKRVVKTLRSILRGSVSAKHLGGPITIFTVSYKYTQVGFMRGLLFMAVISINLAILNILPIPVLDGGWLMFLIIEKIKGSPVSERAMGYFQWAGLVFILGLMAFVTWNDIGRLFR